MTSSFEIRKRTALVVDDSMLVRHAVCRFLEERNFQVEAATNGVEALEMLAGMSPDIIITDMQMPKMSGLEFIGAVRKDVRTAGIPVVILSSLKNSENDKALNVSYRICKDIDIDSQLEQALQFALKA